MKKSNSDQFLSVYNEFVDGVFRFCFYKTSDREVALDITQEVFAKIWEYMKKGGKLESAKAFVYLTANRKVIDWYRAKKNSVSISLDDLRETGFDIKAEDANSGLRIDSALALEKVKELDDIYRDVLLLRYVEDLSVKEIAEALDETENNVSVRIHRGIEKMREIYRKEEDAMEAKKQKKRSNKSERLKETK